MGLLVFIIFIIITIIILEYYKDTDTETAENNVERALESYLELDVSAGMKVCVQRACSIHQATAAYKQSSEVILALRSSRGRRNKSSRSSWASFGPVIER